MKRFVSGVILLSLLLNARIVLAETIDFPVDTPLVTITLPDGWEVAIDKSTLFTQPKATKGAMLPTLFFSYEDDASVKMMRQDHSLLPHEAIEGYFKKTLDLEQLETFERATIERNGVIWKYYDGVSQTADGEVFVTFSCLFPIASSEGAIIIVYFALADADEAFREDVQSIYTSIQAR